MKYFPTIKFSVIALVLTLCSSCSSLIVSQDYDSTKSFESFATFSFEPKNPQRKTDSRSDNALLNSRFYKSITNQLEEKGLRKNDIGMSSDVLVSFNYTIRPKMDLNNIHSQLGFSYGSYYRYGGIGLKTCTDISDVDQGVLLIDIKDGRTGDLIWRGTGTDIVSIHATHEMISSQIEKIVKAVLNQYPPG